MYDHILNTLVSHVEIVFGGVGVPKLDEMREVARELSIIYPAMFHNKSTGGDDANTNTVSTDFKPKPRTQTLNYLGQILVDRVGFVYYGYVCGSL